MPINLPYVSAEEFEQKVNEFAKTNLVLQYIQHWRYLPLHLIKNLCTKVGCKPKSYRGTHFLELAKEFGVIDQDTRKPTKIPRGFFDTF